MFDSFYVSLGGESLHAFEPVLLMPFVSLKVNND